MSENIKLLSESTDLKPSDFVKYHPIIKQVENKVENKPEDKKINTHGTTKELKLFNYNEDDCVNDDDTDYDEYWLRRYYEGYY